MNEAAIRALALRRRRLVALAASLGAAALAIILARAGTPGVLAAPLAWACLLLVWAAAVAPMAANDRNPRHPWERLISWGLAVAFFAAVSRWAMPDLEGPLVPVLAVTMTGAGWLLAWAHRRRRP